MITLKLPNVTREDMEDSCQNGVLKNVSFLDLNGSKV